MLCPLSILEAQQRASCSQPPQQQSLRRQHVPHSPRRTSGTQVQAGLRTRQEDGHRTVKGLALSLSHPNVQACVISDLLPDESQHNNCWSSHTLKPNPSRSPHLHHPHHHRLPGKRKMPGAEIGSPCLQAGQPAPESTGY